MFISHWFEFSGIDKVIAPIITSADANDNAKGSPSSANSNENGNDADYVSLNYQEENPLWGILAPRQEPSVKNNNQEYDDNKAIGEGRVEAFTKAPPAEVFRRQRQQQQPIAELADSSAAVNCVHCHKMTPINSNEENNAQLQQLQQQLLQQKEHLQALYENALRELSSVTKAKCELEEEIKKKEEIEEMKMKRDYDVDHYGHGRCVPNDDNRQQTPTTSMSINYDGGAKTVTAMITPAAKAIAAVPPTDERLIDEQTYLQNQVLVAAIETTGTLTSPTFVWEKRQKLFERCSALPKTTKAQHNKKTNAAGQQQDDGNGDDQQKGLPERSVNLKKIIKELNRDPNLIEIRSANMPPLPDGYTLLHAAVHAGNVEVVEYLLQKYVIGNGDSNSATDGDHDYASSRRPVLDLNIRDLQGRTALHICAEMGHIEVLPLLERAYKELEEIEEKVSNENEDKGEIIDDVQGQLSTVTFVASSSSSAATIPTTPTQAPRTTRISKSKQKFRSPRPPSSQSSSSHLSPKFAGPEAPVDLSGRTPLGYAATSPIPKAKSNRTQLERMLYKSGDRSIVGETTPPRVRSGGLFQALSQRGVGQSGGRKVGFLNGNDGVVDGGGERCDDSDGFIGSPALTSYLSPTPRKATGRTATPFHTPLSSALKTVPEETIMNGVAWGAAEMPGKRIEMEDAILCQYPLEVPPKLLMEEEKLISPLGLFGVFDGHGDGGFASQFISSNLISKLQSNPNWNVAYNEINSDNDSCLNAVLETVFTEAYYDLDKDLKDEESKPRDGGTTAIVALLSGQRILVANVGDSRCILVKKRAASKNNQNGEEESIGMSQIEVLSLSEDHKPDRPDERARIESAGLAIHIDQIPFNEDDKNGQYVMISKVKKSDKEMLGVARAFGDYDYKSNEELSSSRQAVVCTPDFVAMERADSEDMFLILACDGVFDVMSNDEVGLFVTNGVNAAIATLTKEDRPVEAEVLASVGDGLLAECLEKGSTDNMSVLIVALPASGLSSHGKHSAPVTARTLAFG